MEGVQERKGPLEGRCREKAGCTLSSSQRKKKKRGGKDDARAIRKKIERGKKKQLGPQTYLGELIVGEKEKEEKLSK